MRFLYNRNRLVIAADQDERAELRLARHRDPSMFRSVAFVVDTLNEQFADTELCWWFSDSKGCVREHHRFVAVRGDDGSLICGPYTPPVLWDSVMDVLVDSGQVDFRLRQGSECNVERHDT